MKFQNRFLLIAIILFQYNTFIFCKKSSNDVPKVSEEKFQFTRSEPGNALGIVPTVIAIIEREAKQTKEIWRINKAFLTDETWLGFLERCDDSEGEEGAVLAWKDCSYTNEGITYSISHGVPEPKNKTITYLSIDFNPFQRLSKTAGKKEVCKLNEVYEDTVYIVLNTWSEFPKNDTFPRSVVENVKTAHQHQLDRFGPSALSVLGELIDQDKIYQFDKEDYFKRESPYECFLAVASSASETVIQEKCSFGCLNYKEVDEDSPEYEKYLKMAYEQGQLQLDDDDDIDQESYDHDEL